MACTETFYLQSATSLQEQITRYGQIITALENQVLNFSVGNSDVSSYSLDDGQVKIQTQYRDPISMAKAIEHFERLKQTALNKLNGRNYSLRNWRSLR